MSKSPRPNFQGLSWFTRRRRRLIVFGAPLAIALALALAFGFTGRTVTAQKDAGNKAEAALEGKADFLLRETYRATGAIKKQPASDTEAQGSLRAEDEIRASSKIIDVSSRKAGSVGLSDAAQSANPIDDSTTFVRQHYLDFLNREPDAAGWQFWVDNIESCGEDAECREVKRIDTSAAYFLSIEFQQTGYLVHRFYKASFGRRPLFSEFLTDTQVIGRGVVVNSPEWEQLLEDNIRSFADSWVTRPAFISIYDGLDNAQYVDTLIVNTDATFSSTDRDAFVDVLNNSAMTRAQVLRLIAENEAFFNSEYNHAFVEMQYFGYLRRNPQDPPDNNLDGYNFWLNKLNEFGGDFREAEMVKAFLISGEYRERFGTP